MWMASALITFITSCVSIWLEHPVINKLSYLPRKLALMSCCWLICCLHLAASLLMGNRLVLIWRFSTFNSISHTLGCKLSSRGLNPQPSWVVDGLICLLSHSHPTELLCGALVDSAKMLLNQTEVQKQLSQNAGAVGPGFLSVQPVPGGCRNCGGHWLASMLTWPESNRMPLGH